jgi:DNA replication protein DnaC
VVFLGPPGTGKTHVSIALGVQAARRGHRVAFATAHQSLIVSSNKTFSARAEIFGDPVAVAAMVDRLVHDAEVIVLKGDSYRLRGKREEVMTSGKER